MNLLKRIKFAIQYDIEPEFIVYASTDQIPYRGLRYADAKKVSDNQIQNRPNIMVVVRKRSSK